MIWSPKYLRQVFLSEGRTWTSDTVEAGCCGNRHDIGCGHLCGAGKGSTSTGTGTERLDRGKAREIFVRRRGMALLVVMVLVMFVSLAAYRYSFEMENEYRLTRLQEEQVQARLCAQSGIEFVASLLEQPLQVRQAVLQKDDAQSVFGRIVEQKGLEDRTLSPDRQGSQWRFAILSHADLTDSARGVPDTAGTTQSSRLSSIESLDGNESIWKWGLESESAKLHIPTLLKWNQMRPGLARTVLLTLPEADEETVDGWLATLGVRTANTAPQDAMQTAMGGGMQSNLQRQQRIQSLERFKLRWLGGDLDQNYRLDPWEQTLMERLLSDSTTGNTSMNPMARELSKINSISMGQGTGDVQEGQGPAAWNRYLTWIQGERNERTSGKRRIWLNQPDLRRLHQELSEVMSASDANFVVAMRQYGPGTSAPGTAVQGVNGTRPATTREVTGRGVAGIDGSPVAGVGGASNIQAGQWVPNWQVPSKYNFKSPVELVGATLTIEAMGSSASPSSSDTSAAAASKRINRQTMTSPWNGTSSDVKTRIAKILAETSTVDQPVIEGRVDIATASAFVLSAIPGVTPQIAQRIVQSRQESAESSPRAEPGVASGISSIVWLVEKGIVDWVKLGELEPYITTRSDVFSLQSVGFRDDRTPMFRSTVLIDARQIPAQVRDMRVWHPWDRGFTTESLTQSVP